MVKLNNRMRMITKVEANHIDAWIRILREASVFSTPAVSIEPALPQ